MVPVTDLFYEAVWRTLGVRLHDAAAPFTSAAAARQVLERAGYGDVQVPSLKHCELQAHEQACVYVLRSRASSQRAPACMPGIQPAVPWPQIQGSS